MVATKELKSWQEKLVEASKLRGQSGLAAYRRVQLLNEVFDDTNWRDRVGLNDDDKAMNVLDEYVEDLCLTFAELREMLRHCPQREKWGTGKLASLYREMRSEQVKASKLGDDERPARKGPVKRSEYESLEQVNREIEHKAKQLTETIAQDRDEISQLRRENAQLREELAEARGRIKQLEKVLSRELATA